VRFDDSKIEEIKSRVDIVELASEYLTLKKAGRNYLGLCPFHQEKRLRLRSTAKNRFFTVSVAEKGAMSLPC